MSDAARRTLARSAATPPERARVLAERARSGELLPWKLDLAILCADPAARLLQPDALEVPSDATDWVWALAGCGKPVVIRTGLFASRSLIPLQAQPLRGERLVRQALDAAEAWLAHPTPQAAERANALEQQVRDAHDLIASTLASPAGALGQRLHGLDEDAVRTVALLVRLCEECGLRDALQRKLAAWALS